MTSVSSVNGNASAAKSDRDSLAGAARNNPQTTTAASPNTNDEWVAGPVTYRRIVGGWEPINQDDQMRILPYPGTPQPTTPVPVDRYAGEEKLISNLARELQTRSAALQNAEKEYEAAKKALDSTPQTQGGGGCFGGAPSINPAWTTAKATLDRATTALDSARAEYRTTVQMLDRAIDMVPVGAGGGASSTEQMIRRRDELMNGVNAAVTAERRAEQALAEAKAQPNFGPWAGFFGRPNWQETVNRAQAALDAARAATLQASTLLTGYINADVRTTTATASS